MEIIENYSFERMTIARLSISRCFQLICVTTCAKWSKLNCFEQFYASSIYFFQNVPRSSQPIRILEQSNITLGATNSQSRLRGQKQDLFAENITSDQKPFFNCLVYENALTAEANVFSYVTRYDKLIYVSYLFFRLFYNLIENSFALDKLQFDRF